MMKIIKKEKNGYNRKIMLFGFSKIEFDPIPEKKLKKVRLHVKIDEDANVLIPNQKMVLHPVWRARFIESSKVRNFLKMFNREYKLYFTLEKSN